MIGSPSQSGKIMRFGLFELDTETQQLRRAGGLLRIQPQPFKVLALLVCRGGQVVSREELRYELWGNETFVDFEQGLNYCIRQIRAVLGDEAQTPRYIETIPRRGYRFIAPVDAGEQLAATGPGSVGKIKRTGWPRSWPWLAGAVLLVALIVVASYLARIRSAPHLSKKDSIVLADFANSTGDKALDDVLKQAVAIELERSPFLNILSDERVAATVKLMNRQGQRLTLDAAREVCLRTNSAVMLAGSIASVGSHYLLGLRAIECQTGDTIASAEAEAENRDKILYALQKAGNELRQKLGESLASVNRFNKPFPEATTSSLEALKAYAAATSTARPEALSYLQRAVQLDPNFALAYAALGVRYGNFGQRELARENFKKAYEMRNRVSDRERFYIEAHYYEGVTGQTERANQSYLQWIQEYPEDFTPYGNLGYNYTNLGYYDKAVTVTREALRLSPDFATFHGDLEGDYLALGRLDEARAVFDQAVARKIDGVVLRAVRYYLAFIQNDSATMQEQVAWATGKPGLEDWLLSAESDTAAYYGRLGKAHEFSQLARESAKRDGALETAAGWEINEALRWAEFGYPDRSRHAVADALRLNAGPDLEIIAALALARAGDAGQARKLADALDQQFPLDTMKQAYWLPTVRASLELDRGHAMRAIELLQTPVPYELAPTPQFQIATMYPIYVRGLAYLSAGRGGEAAAEFQKILDHRSLVVNFPLASLANLQLARAKALSHDPDAARKAYQDFFALWKDADSDIPILQAARAEYEKLREF